tara:strand:- start:48 stop:227 length:180 start_codon:yes stop_codon:yes gene_type:complete
MTNRRALRISNGSVIYKRDLIRFGKKKKKKEKQTEYYSPERIRQIQRLTPDLDPFSMNA